MRLLVTGGAGYIGGHFVSRALELGAYDIAVVDDLSTGLQRRVPSDVPLYQLDLSADKAVEQLSKILSDHQIDAVVHFAAKKAVNESVEQPEMYFRNNIGGLVNLLSAMRDSAVQKIVFSSSASVYGQPCESEVFENTACHPINSYGQTKLINEQSLHNAERAWGLSAVALRYFNVAGATSSELADTTTTNLMPAIRNMLTSHGVVSVYGDAYPTPDGTCIRDYVHIEDLVDAHIVALDALGQPNATGVYTYNVGTGIGSSVLDIVHAFQRVPGVDLEYQIAPPRDGDAATVTANVDKIREELGWKASYGVEDIVESVVKHPPLATEPTEG
ncbi:MULTISPECIES: UDP-glucose 4-epimerase GalE [Auritidibacter]|uniref:UDP-glucose 4-epimerase GalE n=1 Tax=Auritidibacter TaxID=1160973 RepID=UPI000D737CE3|nr:MULTISPECIES: UDP-glucose 4-epimerase GalE [Auritidibacter]PXA80471.1 UDP-glucose 4-epimerase GalE [Auritidibacter sp. NML120779]AXR73303.1 UDP-glucose 4-epimerase GalE [Auritidibacter sp. NML130574]NIH70927.1 UDP-glucose 4-epimerase [Auritidibacter ignavus]PXA76147.1 UDP-glucose 4-epimerase GalE [Auritidibacter sp. NML100628]PXA82058.1 UDP-glucose 4-epimerase GalE [Auritidibacter sp. NML120636]